MTFLEWLGRTRPPGHPGRYASGTQMNVKIDGRLVSADQLWYPDMNFGQFRWDAPIRLWPKSPSRCPRGRYTAAMGIGRLRT